MVSIRDDAAASHIIRGSKRSLERLGDERLPETLSRKSPVYGKPWQEDQGQVIEQKPAYIPSLGRRRVAHLPWQV